MSLTAKCAEFIEGLSYDCLSPEAITISVHAIMDTVGTIMAGCREPVSEKLLSYLAEDRQPGNATVFGTTRRLAPASAALINATMAHALDYDDMSTATRAHPSAVIAPVALTLGEVLGKGGKDVITAYVCGLEIITKVGLISAFDQYVRGWHTTSTLGALGAAATAAKLMGLTASETAIALGIAASGAGGLQKNFGTMTKPLHCGLAAQTGIMSAELARRGFTASEDIFSDPAGYHSVFGGKTESLTWENEVVFGKPFAVETAGLHLKRYPCCFGTHRAAEAMLSILNENTDITAAKVESITCRGPQGAFQALIHNRPQTGLQGKFSMQYVMAAAVLDRRLILATFTDEMVRRSEAQELMERVEKVEDLTELLEGPNGEDRRFTEVVVRCTDGRSFSKRVDRPRGAPDVPLTDEEIKDKYFGCANGLLAADVQEKTAAMLMNLPAVEEIGRLVAFYRLTDERVKD